jgi:uncharacterized protein YciI
VKQSARDVKSLFVIELVYKAELEKIDAAMSPHMAYLKKYYTAGNFVVSGRKIPRDGGIILAVGESREHVERIAREDPFYERGLSDFRIVEFRPSQRTDDVQKYFA